MRSKPLNRANAARARRDPALTPPPPSGKRPNRTNQIVTAVVLLAFGAVIALSVDRLVPTNGGAKASASPTLAADASVAPSDSLPPDSSVPPSEAPSGPPTASPSPTAAILESMLPTSVDGTTLTITSAKGTDALGNGPTTRALAAGVVHLGKSATDLELGYAYDAAGETTMTILAFRLPGVDPNDLKPVILGSLLVATTPGVTTTSLTLSGTQVTKVDYGDESAFEYVFIRGDSVFVIETSDEQQATDVIAAMPPASAEGTPAPSSAATAAPTPAPTPAPSTSPSP